MAILHVIVIILTVLIAILLIGIVLIQKSKGGGLSSQFGGAGAVMGVRQTNNFLEKGTWTLAAIICVLSIVSAYTMPKMSSGAEIRTQSVAAPATPAANQYDSKAAPAIPAAPAAPTAPAGE